MRLPKKIAGVTVILFQRGATGWGFQIGRLYWQINYWRYVFMSRNIRGKRTWSLGYAGWEKD